MELDEPGTAYIQPPDEEAQVAVPIDGIETLNGARTLAARIETEYGIEGTWPEHTHRGAGNG